MTEAWNNSVGEHLLTLRSQKKMTQEELAEYLNVSRQSVSKWELNKTLPDVEKLILLADLYEVTLDYLLKGVEIKKVEPQASGEDVMAEPAQEQKDGEQNEQIEEEAVCSLEMQSSAVEMSICRIVFLLAMAVSGVLCISAFVYSILLMGHYAFSLENKQQSGTLVDRIYEQYTLADVVLWDDNENYHTEKVWLDIAGVREGDAISYYSEEGKLGHARFAYYAKTWIFPLMVSILLLIFTIIFGMGFQSCEKRDKGNEKKEM